MSSVRKILGAAIAILVTLAMPLACPAQEAQPKTDKAKEQPTSFWMNRKLHFSQELLAGITAGDFDKVTTSAQAMRALNKVEAFMRNQTPGYRTQLQIFEESLDEIIRQADKDNVEGAALGFTQLTINCVNCHKQLRAAK
jgi:hypothetical protein